MSVAKILVWVLIIWTAVFGVYYVRDVLKHKEDFKDVKYIPAIIIGVLANFFDTLGIGSYATSTTAFKFTKTCPDDLIPGTLNVAYAIPVVTEAVVFIQKVTVDPLTLVLMIGAAVLGAVIGASVVSKWDLKKVRIALGAALIALAIVMVCKLLGVGILCSCSCPSWFGHNGPVNLQQDKCYSLFCHFLSLYEWKSVLPGKIRALRLGCPV